MNKEYKEILMRDLSARLPYGVKGQIELELTTSDIDLDGSPVTTTGIFDVELIGINADGEIQISPIGNEEICDFVNEEVCGENLTVEDFKPYLKLESSMSDEEKAQYDAILHKTCLALMFNTLTI